ncbi:hypothetical protein [Streptomyces sp. NPDC002553]|uniref:hypothetical protein n=1 Tax=unclassified Streptomyces TaxID=2593676 RepID=UPI00332AC726
MNHPTNGGRRGRHRRRWTATGLLLGVPAVLVPYLLFVQEDSEAALYLDATGTELLACSGVKRPRRPSTKDSFEP